MKLQIIVSVLGMAAAVAFIIAGARAESLGLPWLIMGGVAWLITETLKLINAVLVSIAGTPTPSNQR